jgi:hypothetical protein
MKLKIEIAMDNAAFEDDRGAEVARILAQYAKRCGDGGDPEPCTLHDFNGNTVGHVKVTH